MDSTEFKKVFGLIAKSNGFESAFGGWFKESSECILVLDLQKSNYGNYFELNVKIFIQGMFGNTYVKSKGLVKKDAGDVFTRQPNDYKETLDLEISLSEETRREGLEVLFSEFVVPFTDKALTKVGIQQLANNKEIHLLPAVKQELVASN